MYTQTQTHGQIAGFASVMLAFTAMSLNGLGDSTEMGRVAFVRSTKYLTCTPTPPHPR